MQYEGLIDNYLNGNLSINERKRLENWVMKNPEHLKIFKKRVRSHSFVIPMNFDSDKAFEKFYTKLQLKKRQRRRRFRIISIAASLTVLIVLGFLYQKSEIIIDKKNSLSSTKQANESLKHIQITLPDGSQQLIDKKSTMSLTTEIGEVVANRTDNVLTFGDAKRGSADTSITRIDIPYGEKFKLKLSDGTLVWLNSGTSLKFPQTFGLKAKTRTVEVIGEAYFEVAKDREKPFIVHSPSVDIKVLGTRFNITSYPNDSKAETTLMEGEVNVYKSSEEKNPLKLRPNQQAVFSKTEKSLKINKVLASDFNSWIDNILIVDGLSFLELKKKLERRYNVTIVCEIETLLNNRYRGKFEDESLAETLKTIALSSDFDFEIKGKQVRIFDKKN
ncbi:FecR family protein [Psychroflexus sp. CAK57W]|uniref:FecR family protein n=1 Tax=Psychroflexus curvus TaxID=2873595 RepID=UPI001CC93838|nr:FecR family protein [Psychroflexus curvus]MBZ9785944.1 FecR family protein [Psychroflexus curvus]